MYLCCEKEEACGCGAKTKTFMCSVTVLCSVRKESKARVRKESKGEKGEQGSIVVRFGILQVSMEEARFRELSFCDLCLMMVSEEDDEGCMTYYDGGFLFRFAVKCDLRKLGSGSKRFSQMWNSLVRDEEDEEDQDGEMLMLVLTVIAQGWRCRLSFLVDSWWLAWLLTAKLKVV
ncbi:uncharacterized protein HKW66_Vig0115900 [Vigna angularis]|uniref:Uncharacterized protein n=1 Tax=Phaseolus angularis TaxID=3914 RepID=A0A8T0L0N3_PHAAN|nr:uncharacterized protein HKW66_Vig0115900 [Vigna angularis]